MDLLQTILNAQGGGTVEQLALKFGLDRGQASGAIEQLLPALATGIQRNTRDQGGLESLIGALSSGNHDKYLDDPVVLTAPETVDDGNGILGHVLGSKAASRQVASRAAAETGIGADVLKKMLPLVATLVMGALGKQTANARSQPSGDSAELPGLLGALLGGGSDGSSSDALSRMLGKPDR